MQLRQATRAKAKIRLGLSAVAGGGKTYSAIVIGKGLAHGDLSKVAVIDTENGSADLYAHLGPFQVITLEPPYSPERYIQAIKACEDAGMEVVVVDSITHEWSGKGGILEIADGMTGNSFQKWSVLTPRHNAFISAILTSKIHVITTVRRKQDYEMTKGSDGKTKVEKLGLREETRDGYEYEVTANLELDIKHNATASKDRTGLFMDKPHFIPSEQTGKMLLDWCESGVDIPPPVDPIAKAIAELFAADSLGAVSGLWIKYKQYQKDPAFVAAKDQMKAKLSVKDKDLAGAMNEQVPDQQRD